MFTGIVRGTGVVEETRRGASGTRLVVSLGPLADGVRVGDSVSVSGVCLTAAGIDRDRALFDAVAETLSRTTLGALSPGDRVNVEPALRAGDPLGGHFVTGHVDGVATLRSREDSGDSAELTFDLDDRLLADVVEKGSVAVDGVSLTVASLVEGGFRVAAIPHTLQVTTLGDLRPGSRVNVETDLLVKAVRRVLLEPPRGTSHSADKDSIGGACRTATPLLTEEFLREHGFA